MLAGTAQPTLTAAAVPGGPPAAITYGATPPSTPHTASSAAPGQPPANAPIALDPSDLLFASPTRIDHIGRIVVAVEIDGKGPFRFIVDTGANYSTISPALASLLKLTPSMAAGILVDGITGTARVPSVPIAKLKAGDVVMEHMRVPVVWAPLMAGAEGILGVAGLKDDRLFVDFERNRVAITRSRHAFAAPHDFIWIPAQRIRGGLVSVDARVGGIRVVAIIDTGSARTIANTALHDILDARRRQKEVPKVTSVYGATSEVARGELETAPTIDLGPVRIGSATLVYGDFHIFDVWDLARRPAMILGMDILGTVSALSIDFREPAIYLSSNYRFDSAVLARSPCRLLADGMARCTG